MFVKLYFEKAIGAPTRPLKRSQKWKKKMKNKYERDILIKNNYFQKLIDFYVFYQQNGLKLNKKNK